MTGQDHEAMSWVSDMREAFFRVDRDYLLSYEDPAIGRFENHRHGIRLSVNPAVPAIELSVQGDIVESFALTGDIREICLAAAGAYFRAFENLLHTPELSRSVA